MIGEMTLNADQVLWIHSISVASMPEYFPDPVEWLLPIHIGKYNKQASYLGIVCWLYIIFKSLHVVEGL